MQQLNGLVRTNRFEIESLAMKRIEELLYTAQAREQPSTLKAEIYEFTQSKLNQTAQSFNQRLKLLSEEIESHSERLRGLSETKSDFELNFEEFRANFSLK